MAATRRRWIVGSAGLAGVAAVVLVVAVLVGSSDDDPVPGPINDAELQLDIVVEPVARRTITTVHPTDDGLLLFGVEEPSRRSTVWRQLDDGSVEELGAIDIVGTPFVYQVVDVPTGFVAVGELVFDEAGSTDPLFLHSADGVEWTVTADPTVLGAPEVNETVTGVVADGAGGFFAVGPLFSEAGVEAGLWVSPDGRDWSAVALGDLEPGSALWALVPFADGFLAVGERDDGAGPEPQVFLSPDGVRWSAVGFPLHAPGGGYLADVAVVDGGLVVGGPSFDGDGLLAVSATGDRWRRVDRQLRPDGVVADAVDDVVADGEGGAYVVGPIDGTWLVQRLRVGQS